MVNRAFFVRRDRDREGRSELLRATSVILIDHADRWVKRVERVERKEKGRATHPRTKTERDVYGRPHLRRMRESDGWVSDMGWMERVSRMMRRDRITTVDKYHHTSSAKKPWMMAICFCQPRRLKKKNKQEKRGLSKQIWCWFFSEHNMRVSSVYLLCATHVQT